MATASEVLLHLSLIDGVGVSTLHTLIQHWSAHTWADFYSFSVADFNHAGVRSSISAKIVAGLACKKKLQQELMLIEKHRITFCTVFDSIYPESLRSPHVPPPLLYWRGNLTMDTHTYIACVGSRKATSYGERIMQQWIPRLISHGITIVSGGAIGIDSMAHQETVRAGGTTIVVLGSGLLRPYPYMHIDLFEKVIASGGAVVSSFSLHTSAHQANFPARNRIISGLSDGVVVVQAAEKSGARITAQYALEQGKDVFAVPGLMDDPLSVGCHRLIQEGAHLVTCASDLIAFYGLEQKQQIISSVQSYHDAQSIEAIILTLCKQAQNSDALAAHTNRSLLDLQDILFSLQLDGLIVQDYTGMWKTV